MGIDGKLSVGSKLPAVLMLDTSGSMQGEKINQLNSSARLFFETIKEDNDISNTVELSVVTFGKTVKVVCGATLVKDFETENVISQINDPDGQTPLGAAITKSIEIIEERRRFYKDNLIKPYKPLIIIITDGVPTDEWEAPAKRIRTYSDNNKLIAYALGVKGADIETLEQITSQGNAVTLENADFTKLFKFVTDSLKALSKGNDKTEGTAADLLKNSGSSDDTFDEL